jgi:hypothetical protein
MPQKISGTIKYEKGESWNPELTLLIIIYYIIWPFLEPAPPIMAIWA